MKIATLAYRTCLLIDDNYIDNYINNSLLKRHNFAENIIISQNAQEALRLLKNGTIKPEVIFLDIEMPVMGGFDFLKEYDKLELDKQAVKIVLLSSSIDPADIRKAAKNKYISTFITKPLTDKAIEQLCRD